MSFEPVYNEHSRALILGTWPSPKSREMAFYYGHPQNRFWPMLAALTGEQTPAREVAGRLRDEEGWSNKAIARHLGVHPSTVGRWFARPELTTRDEQETP